MLVGDIECNNGVARILNTVAATTSVVGDLEVIAVTSLCDDHQLSNNKTICDLWGGVAMTHLFGVARCGLTEGLGRTPWPAA